MSSSFVRSTSVERNRSKFNEFEISSRKFKPSQLSKSKHLDDENDDDEQMNCVIFPESGIYWPIICQQSISIPPTEWNLYTRILCQKMKDPLYDHQELENQFIAQKSLSVRSTTQQHSPFLSNQIKNLIHHHRNIDRVENLSARVFDD